MEVAVAVAVAVLMVLHLQWSLVAEWIVDVPVQSTIAYRIVKKEIKSNLLSCLLSLSILPSFPMQTT